MLFSVIELFERVMSVGASFTLATVIWKFCSAVPPFPSDTVRFTSCTPISAFVGVPVSLVVATSTFITVALKLFPPSE